VANRLESEFMLKASELLRQGKTEELWQMCCGYLKLNIKEFMDIQERLLLEQLELLKKSPIGKKIMKGAEPKTVKEFRELVPLTTYADYCPELEQKREDVLPIKPDLWTHSSGRSGKYPYKWVPIPPEYIHELSKILYGIGMLSCSDRWGDTSHIPKNIKILYSVAPSPYVSGIFADILKMQTPVTYMPTIEESENLIFENRIKLGFQQSISKGIDYFFGISLVLVSMGEKFLESSDKIDIKPYLRKPNALWRLVKGKLKSCVARRGLLPKDIWSLRGIVGSGLDSWVYKDKIRELWGRKPLDLYSCTEGGVIATQTWDYNGMTFIPNLNFLEFIPEEETLKWQMDSSYQPRTVLLNEVEARKNYELVFTNFHGGVLVRYRIGDMIKIISSKNENTGIELPQMVFERRVDDVIDLFIVRLTERTIWQAIESAGIPYVDWVAYKDSGRPVLKLYIELKNESNMSESDINSAIYNEIMKSDSSDLQIDSPLRDEMAGFADFSVESTRLPSGTFVDYKTRKQNEGADLAHLKPPHINPPKDVLSSLMGETEEIIIIKEIKSKAISENKEEKVIT
jgi:hypothetical protein